MNCRQVAPISIVLAAAYTSAMANEGPLLGAEYIGNVLLEIEQDDGAPSGIGLITVDFGTIQGLAFDYRRNVAYGSNPSTDRIYLINPETAEAVPLSEEGALGPGNWNGLAFDGTTDTLYCINALSNLLITVDIETGAGSPLGFVTGGFVEIEGLAFDELTGTLYGLSRKQHIIITIDTDTLEAQAVGESLPAMGNWAGLAFDYETGLLFATHVIGTDLYSIDPQSGEIQFIGETGGPKSAVGGLAALSTPDCTCSIADFDFSGSVDTADLLQLLGDWGQCPGCPTDLNDNGEVDTADLLELLSQWGPC